MSIKDRLWQNIDELLLFCYPLHVIIETITRVAAHNLTHRTHHQSLHNGLSLFIVNTEYHKAARVTFREITRPNDMVSEENFQSCTFSINGYSQHNTVCKHSFNATLKFLHHNRDIMFFKDITHDSHKFSKIVPKFWIRMKRVDTSHMCPADTNNVALKTVLENL